MKEFDSKVVPFRRNASYLHQRALKNKRDGSRLDALELLRQALGREPNNTTYALDMAQLCSEMGLFEQSNRLLMRAMTNGDASPECLYGMALNLYKQGDISRAERVLRAYIDDEKQAGAHTDDAARLLDEISYARESNIPEQRKLRRAMRIVNRACDAMRKGDAETGERLFEKSIAIYDYAPEVHALYALSLFMRGDYDSARAEARASVDMAHKKRPGGGVNAICISAQVLNYLGDREEAVALIKSALPLEAEENEQRLRINALCEMGLHELVGEQTAIMLREYPYDKMLLHISSVAAYNQNASKAKVLKGWQRIQRLDPDDPICEYFISRINSENPPERPMEYLYALPHDEVLNRIRYLSECMARGEDALTDAWKNDKRFRSIIEWELSLNNERLTCTALTILSGVNDDTARMTLRVYAERPDTPVSLRMYALTMIRLLDITETPVLRKSFAAAALPSEDEAMENMPVAQKQMIRYAADYIEDEYGEYPVADIALLWRAYLAKRNGVGDPVRRTEVGSAALAYIFLSLRDEKPSIGAISKWFACPHRQVEHIVRSLRDVIINNENDEDDNP